MRILVVEDEQKTADYLQQGLNESGYVVDCAANGVDGLHLAGQHAYELVILDVNLPGKDGWQVLEQLRRNGTQRVMMLTARGRLADKIKGLDMGADDYLVKPFVMAELLARINALVRRSQGRASASISIGDLHLDTVTQSISLAGRPVRLTAMEYRLLAYLAHHAGRPVSKTELTEHLYQQDFDRDSNTLEVLVARLRKKLGDDKIETLRGQGYRLPLPDAG